MRRPLLFSLAALLVLSVVARGVWRARLRRTPEYALRQLAAAVDAKDQRAFETYFDTQRVAQSAADNLVASALTEAAPDPGADLGLGMQLAEGYKPALAALLEASIVAAVRDEPPQGAFLAEPPDLRRFRGAFQDIESVERRENRAHVRLRVHTELQDTPLVVTLGMERRNGVWRAVRVEDLGGLAQRLHQNRLENAYVAVMKSYLRNLVTAERMFFAESGRYTTDLGTRYRTTTGVTGPTITITPGGFTAWVGSPNTTTRCAVFVGAVALAPAVREGEPRCQERP